MIITTVYVHTKQVNGEELYSEYDGLFIAENIYNSNFVDIKFRDLTLTVDPEELTLAFKKVKLK